MWRIVPLLAVLGCIEVLVPWPDVAALVLSHANRTETHAISDQMTGSSIELRHDRPQLLVQSRAAAP